MLGYGQKRRIGGAGKEAQEHPRPLQPTKSPISGRTCPRVLSKLLPSVAGFFVPITAAVFTLPPIFRTDQWIPPHGSGVLSRVRDQASGNRGVLLSLFPRANAADGSVAESVQQSRQGGYERRQGRCCPSRRAGIDD